ncbi:hypothetical protein [Bacillus niameyensis]|uniref:hypothetical protein n=1 Tax=Bacillus niameyensis TaxID=1522308 RepID=UPI0008411D98|nr:hypothetical protein [Bacillus niameyensis]
MKVAIDSLVIFFIAWGIPVFMVTRVYLKMGTDDKKSVRNDFSSKQFIFTTGFFLIGVFLIHLGATFTVNMIKVMGLVLFSVGGFFTILDSWNKSKIRSLLFLILVSSVVFLNVI